MFYKSPLKRFSGQNKFTSCSKQEKKMENIQEIFLFFGHIFAEIILINMDDKRRTGESLRLPMFIHIAYIILNTK